MTGIQRLRKLIEDYRAGRECDGFECTELSCGKCMAKNVLEPIADQIERESDVETVRSEAMEAWRWVREHGGLEKIKLDALCWNTAENIAQTTLDWLARVCPVAGIEKCGYGGALERLEDAINRRLMPEGYEWPRYETGELLRYKDRYIQDGREREVWHVDFDSCGEPTILNKDGTRFHPDKGERVKRPAPKVPDADGAEIYKGRIAYGTRGRKYRVTELCEYEPSIVHAQAIDDGELGDEFIAANTGLNSYQLDASKLTHERPESWQRLEEDANDLVYDIGFHLGDYSPSDFNETGDSIQDRVRDLVRRCRALAERERGE